jgi:hypothetical protein
MTELLTSTEQTFASGAGGWSGGAVSAGKFVADLASVGLVEIVKTAAANNTYTLGFDISAADFASATMFLQFRNGAGSIIDLASSELVASPDGRRSLSGTAPTGTASVRFAVSYSGDGEAVSFAIDNASLDESAPTSSTITGTAAGSITLAGTISGVPRRQGAASGTISLTGAVAGQRRVSGALTGTVGLTGTIAGQRRVGGALTGTVGLTGTIAGQRRVGGALTGAIGLAGVIAGTSSSAVDPGGYVTLVTTAPTATLATNAPGCALATAGPQVAMAVTVAEVTLAKAFAASVQLTSSREE